MSAPMLRRALTRTAAVGAAPAALLRTAMSHATGLQFTQRAVKMDPMPQNSADAFLCGPCGSVLAVATGTSALEKMRELHRNNDPATLPSTTRDGECSMCVAALENTCDKHFIGVYTIGSCGVIVIRRDGRLALSARFDSDVPEQHCIEAKEGDIVALISQCDSSNDTILRALREAAECGPNESVETIAEDILQRCRITHDNTVVVARISTLGAGTTAQPPATL